MATIPFDEIVPGATVRFTTVDGVQYLSISDIIKHICAKNFRGASKVWRNLSEAKKAEVWQNGTLFQFPGQGQSEQPVITFKGALKLTMLLSGEKAALHRSAMVEILSRYYAGDDSLTDEIEDNASSTSAVAQMARSALASEGALENPKKRARISAESFSDVVSVLLKSMESEITGQLRGIAAGQEDTVARITQVDAKQDDMYQKLYELTNELNLERARNASVCKTLGEKLEAEKSINEINSRSLLNMQEELKTLSGELSARQAQIERQTAAIAHLNNTIRAKDAQLAKKDATSDGIHEKLDLLLAKGATASDDLISLHNKTDLLLTRVGY